MGNAMIVILNEVKNLMISTECPMPGGRPRDPEILRLSPQNDITTQSLDGGE
jgi:hypothetical protein